MKVGSFVVGLATVLSLLLQWLGSRPAKVTVDDWTLKANAICDSIHADARQAVRRALDALDAAFRSIQKGVIDNAVMEKSARGIEDTADAERNVVGGLRNIEPPTDGSESEVKRTLSVGDMLAQDLDQVANMLRKVTPADPSVGAKFRDIRPVSWANNTTMARRLARDQSGQLYRLNR